MSKRNLIWLAVIAVVTIVVWISAGWLWGILAGVATLVVSETVERAARKRRVAASGADMPSVRDAIGSRRKRR